MVKRTQIVKVPVNPRLPLRKLDILRLLNSWETMGNETTGAGLSSLCYNFGVSLSPILCGVGSADARARKLAEITARLTGG